MKRLILAFLLVPSIAFAAPQQPGYTPFGAHGDGTFQPMPDGSTANPMVVTGVSGGGPPYVYTPLGYSQISVSGTAVNLTIPSGATYAFITIGSGGINYRDDGTSPTASVGMPVLAGQQVQYFGSLSAIQFISISGTSVMNVSFYK